MERVFLFLLLLLFPSNSALLSNSKECYNYCNRWSSTKQRRKRGRERDREKGGGKKKRSEYYGSSKNICQFWRYIHFGSANQRKNFGITIEIKRKNSNKRKEIGAISCRRSFSSRTTKKRVYITSCYSIRQSFSTNITRRVSPIIRYRRAKTMILV